MTNCANCGKLINSMPIQDMECVCDECATKQSNNSLDIVWHKYPDEKPEMDRNFGNRTLLVAYTNGRIAAVATADYYFPVFGLADEDLSFGKLEDGIVITHWAYLPTPPKKEQTRTIVIEISKCADCKYRNCARRQLRDGIPDDCPVWRQAEDEKKTTAEKIAEISRNGKRA